MSAASPPRPAAVFGLLAALTAGLLPGRARGQEGFLGVAIGGAAHAEVVPEHQLPVGVSARGEAGVHLADWAAVQAEIGGSVVPSTDGGHIHAPCRPEEPPLECHRPVEAMPVGQLGVALRISLPADPLGAYAVGGVAGYASSYGGMTEDVAASSNVGAGLELTAMEGPDLRRDPLSPDPPGVTGPRALAAAGRRGREVLVPSAPPVRRGGRKRR